MKKFLVYVLLTLSLLTQSFAQPMTVRESVALVKSFGHKGFSEENVAFYTLEFSESLLSVEESSTSTSNGVRTYYYTLAEKPGEPDSFHVTMAERTKNNGAVNTAVYLADEGSNGY